MSCVSVIIPNYNAGKYIDECITSIQKNNCELEIIIVDDGSTDDSYEHIQSIANNDSRIKVKYQTNMNAAVARNSGISIATGDYMLFVDSDDILEEGVIDVMVQKMKDYSVDLVLGNHVLVDSVGSFISNSDDFVNKSYIEYNPMELVDRVPNPPNKLYKTKIIKENQISWGNVRIGQDLNFFLKYLSVCNEVAVIDTIIYRWRIRESSMSHAPSLKILDIVNSFEDTYKYYQNRNKELVYKKYVQCIEFEHLNRQMEKQKLFQQKAERKLIVSYFSYFLKNMMRKDLKSSHNFSKYKRRYITCKLKLALRYIYISNVYRYIMKNR